VPKVPGDPVDRALLGFEQTLWTAADTLRGSLDAGDYKHVVLGLIFLRHALSGAPHALAAAGLEWADVERAARKSTLAQVLDEATAMVEDSNPSLRGALPRYSEKIDARRLGDLVTLLGRSDLASDSHRGKDVLGRVYEYFLSGFASAAGRSGEFYTPRCVVELLVEVLQPRGGVVYDPCCGSGGMFVQSRRLNGDEGRERETSFFGQELNEITWKLARMNLALQGVEADLGDHPADTFHEDLHPALQADFILANPPFNMSDWGGDRLVFDRRWEYGVPSPTNANFAWLQHITCHLSDRGIAGVVLANGSLTANQTGEAAIRAALVRANVVDAIIVLPNKLFYSTAIPASIWILAKQRVSNAAYPRAGEVLFVDASDMGELVSRAHRVLTPNERVHIAETYMRWREGAPVDVPGVSRAVDVEEVSEQGFALLPGRYTAAFDFDDIGDIAEETTALALELRAFMAKSAETDVQLLKVLEHLEHPR
jgi:type I restriction enzyme M protein